MYSKKAQDQNGLVFTKQKFLGTVNTFTVGPT